MITRHLYYFIIINSLYKYNEMSETKRNETLGKFYKNVILCFIRSISLISSDKLFLDWAFILSIKVTLLQSTVC